MNNREKELKAKAKRRAEKEAAMKRGDYGLDASGNAIRPSKYRERVAKRKGAEWVDGHWR